MDKNLTERSRNCTDQDGVNSPFGNVQKMVRSLPANRSAQGAGRRGSTNSTAQEVVVEVL